MSTQPATAAPRRSAALRLALAGLMCFLVLAITIPNLGRVKLPGPTVEYGWADALCIVVIVAPLILIIVGAACSRVSERAGWVLLVILFILRLIS